MRNRLKVLRKILKLSGETFGGKIGLTKATISKMEKGISTITEQTIKSICREYNVREEWLRTGTGEMFNAAPAYLSDITKNMSELEQSILTTYMSFDYEVRNYVLNQFLESIGKLNLLDNQLEKSVASKNTLEISASELKAKDFNLKQGK